MPNSLPLGIFSTALILQSLYLIYWPLSISRGVTSPCLSDGGGNHTLPSLTAAPWARTYTLHGPTLHQMEGFNLSILLTCILWKKNRPRSQQGEPKTWEKRVKRLSIKYFQYFLQDQKLFLKKISRYVKIQFQFIYFRDILTIRFQKAGAENDLSRFSSKH